MNDIDLSSNNFTDFVDDIMKSGKLSHSYLIEVNDGDDFKYINYFIKLILCKKKKIGLSNVNCSDCNICNLVDEKSYPDLKIIETDGQWIKKNQLIDLKNDFLNKSLLDNKKVYVIKYAENLNSSSANSILKFLEEPEDNIIAILLTKNRYKVINTIVSRCQLLSLQNKENKHIMNNNVIEFIQYLTDPKSLFINYKKICENIFIDKDTTKNILLEIELCLVNYLNYKSIDDFKLDDDLDIVSILDSIDINKIVKYVTIIENEIINLNFNVNLKLWLDNLFSKIVEVK